MTCEERESYFEYIKAKIQFFVVSLTIIALLITLYIIYQNMYYNRHNIKPSPQESKKLFNLAKLVTAIFVIVALYYVLRAYEDYQLNPQKAQWWFYIATLLVLAAVLIRYYFVRQVGEGGLEGAEDIV